MRRRVPDNLMRCAAVYLRAVCPVRPLRGGGSRGGGEKTRVINLRRIDKWGGADDEIVVTPLRVKRTWGNRGGLGGREADMAGNKRSKTVSVL